MIRFKIVVLLGSLMFGIGISGTCSADDMTSRLSQPEVPGDVKIISPDPARIPEDIAKLSGKWPQMRWRSFPQSPLHLSDKWQAVEWQGVNAILIVEEIVSPTKAKILYSTGESPEWSLKKRWGRLDAEIVREGEKIILKFTSPRNSNVFVYSFDPKTGRLKGKIKGKMYTETEEVSR